MSKAFNDYAKKIGFDIKGKMSYAQAKQLVPMLTNVFEKEEARKSNKDLKQLGYAQLKDTAAARAEQRKDEQATKRDEKQLYSDIKRIDTAGKTINQSLASSRSAFGKAANVNASAEKALALANQYKDKNQLDSRQISELATVVDTILSMGQGTVAGREKLTPETYLGNLKKIEEKIRAIPQGAGQKEFVDRLVDTIQRERDVANKQIREIKMTAIAPYISIAKRNPEQWDDMARANGFDDLTSDKIDQYRSEQKYSKKEQVSQSSPIQEMINSRSDEENRAQLQRLKQKYGR